MINLASDKKFKIIEYMLEKKTFTQYQVKKDLGTGMSIVNQTFKFLEDKDAIKQKNRKYQLTDAENLIELTAFFRNMEELKIMEIGTSLGKHEIVKLLPETVIYCMETALGKYTNYYKTNTLSFYGSEKTADKLKNTLFYKPGNKTTVIAYKEKPVLNKIETGMPTWKKAGIKNAGKLKFTSPIRTIIDLYSGKKGNTTETLIKHLWGKKK